MRKENIMNFEKMSEKEQMKVEGGKITPVVPVPVSPLVNPEFVAKIAVFVAKLFTNN